LARRRSRTVPPEISSALPLIFTCMKTPKMAQRLNDFNTLSKRLGHVKATKPTASRLDFVRHPPPLCRLLEERLHVETQFYVPVR
jgi:hypothetical protein